MTSHTRFSSFMILVSAGICVGGASVYYHFDSYQTATLATLVAIMLFLASIAENLGKEKK